MLAVPDGFLSEELLVDGAVDGYEGLVGPSKVFEATLLEENDQGIMVHTEFVKSFLVVDLKDDCLSKSMEMGLFLMNRFFPFEDSMPVPKLLT